MRSRLLARPELDTLSEAGNLRALAAALAQTPYRPALEAALVHLAEREALSRALRDDLDVTVGNIRRFYRDKAAARVMLLLRAYDIHNLKALLRGLASGATPDEIRAVLLPAGELGSDVLVELAQAANVRVALDLLATMALPFARPLLRLRAEKPGATTPEMELRLDQWYFQQAFDDLERAPDATLLNALRLEADLVNLQTVLRLATMSDERQELAAALGTGDASDLLVGPGRIPLAVLVRAASAESLNGAIEQLAGTVCDAPLAAGMERYRQTGRLSSFERELYRYRLGSLGSLIAREPLAIGVVLGYLALKMNEVNNLRWIANGIYLGMKPETIRAELVYAP
jgi:vacuolar-type H+-ATPase subunit C/Vma6